MVRETTQTRQAGVVVVEDDSVSDDRNGERELDERATNQCAALEEIILHIHDYER